MPKVDYEKQPFRVCRWNKKQYDLEDAYWCEDGEGIVNSDTCMRCFCNDWYQTCVRCGDAILKTEIKWYFEKDNTRMIYICSECEDGEEVCDNNEKQESWISTIYDIKKWQEVNKNGKL